MYSNKENVNILTVLLVRQGIRHAVVCPGSRNSPIVHNLNETEKITCHPATDERSAGFYALGMCQCLREPVVICVTSGSALLNVAPAVAEAYYQHLPLIVVSADRPQQWIDQLDGQTLRQNNALTPFVRKSVCLNEPRNFEEHWYCNRLVNEALLKLNHHGCGPVHINVPITEPLYEYTVESLPAERFMMSFDSKTSQEGMSVLMEAFLRSRNPMIVIGQDDAHTYEELSDTFRQLKDQVVILYEPLSLDTWKMTRFEEVLSKAQDETLLPDFILYIGDTLVSKRLKAFLRKAEGAETWTVRADGEIHDTFMNLKGIIEGQPAEVIREMATVISRRTGEQQTDYLRLWAEALKAADGKSEEFEPEYSEMATVRYFEQQLEDMEYPFHVQYANSSAVRLANIYAGHHVYCNRGVNGIEGCLSTAAGMSLVTADFVFCVIGDLSFFYDQNALWNHNLKGNLRVILLNNGCGGIFDKFEGLKQSDARDLVMARHQTSAQGICTQNDCGYIKAKNMDEMQLGVVQLLTMDTKRPVVLEVITDADVDTQQLQRYFER